MCEDTPPLKKRSLTLSLPPPPLSSRQVRPSLQGDRSTTPLVCYCPYGNGPPSTPQTLPLPFLFASLSHTHTITFLALAGLFFSSRSCERRVQSLLLFQRGVHVSEVWPWSCSLENLLSKAALFQRLTAFARRSDPGSRAEATLCCFIPAHSMAQNMRVNLGGKTKDSLRLGHFC